MGYSNDEPPEVVGPIRSTAGANDGGGEAIGAGLATAVEEFVTRTFTASLAVMSAVAAATVALTPARSGNDHLLGSLALGLLLLLIPLLALRWRRQVFLRLHSQPWLVMCVAIVSTIAVWVDGGADSTLHAATYTAVVIGAVIGRLWWALACALVLAAVPLIDYALSSGGTTEELETLVFRACTYVLLWALFAPPLASLAQIIRGTPVILEEVRQAGPAAKMLSTTTSANRVLPLERLTPAELRVLRMMCEGLPPKAVALDLDLSIHTVRTHLKRAKRKVEARTLSELVAAVAAARPES